MNHIFSLSLVYFANFTVMYAGWTDQCLGLQDNEDARHIKTYEVSLKDKDFVKGPWSQTNLDYCADRLIPVPSPLCGALIIGQETIVYCSADTLETIAIGCVSVSISVHHATYHSNICTDLSVSTTLYSQVWYVNFNLYVQSITKAYGRVDVEGSRYLLGDYAGQIHLLVMAHQEEKWVDIYYKALLKWMIVWIFWLLFPQGSLASNLSVWVRRL